jgi:hypothetical protein
MKWNYIFIFVGAAIGFYLGNASRTTDMGLIWEVFCGAGVGYSVYRVLSEGLYDILIGMVMGLVVTLSLDWLAGSTLDVKDKLSYMFLGGFIGWLFVEFWKEIFIGGLFGGIIGFVWGLNDSYWFGKVNLPPGIFNASLLAVKISILGMILVSLYVGYFGSIFSKGRKETL